MDELTFIAEMTKALAWPVLVFMVVLLFRVQLRDLIRTVKRGKIGPAELEFERVVEELESVASDLSEQATDSRAEERIRQAAEHPRAAVLEAWMKLEDRAIDLALSRGLIPATARRYAGGVIRKIKNAGLLEADHLNVLEELQYLRNQAAHSPDFNPTADSVIGYLKLADSLCRALDEIPR